MKPLTFLTGVAVVALAGGCNPAEPAATIAPAASSQTQIPAGPAGSAAPRTGTSLLDAPDAGVNGPVGPFLRTEPSGGELNLRREGENWRVWLVAGGVPNGAATAADCEVQALGQRTGERITARVVPFKGELNEVSAEDLDGTTIPVTITLAGNTATVDANEATGALCAIGSDLGGRYVKAE